MVLYRSAALCKQERSCRVIAWFSIVLLLSANKRGVVGLLPGSLSFRCCLQTRAECLGYCMVL